jgi:spore germination protein YaaH
LEQFDRLLFFELKINSNGEISERNGWPEKWGDLILATEQAHTPLDLTLTLLDEITLKSLFSSSRAIERLTEEIVALADQSPVAGIHLDVEVYSPIETQTLNRYKHFVRNLSNRIHQLSPSKNLSVFFPIGAPSLLYDVATLEQIDHVVLQGYDTHWTGSKTAGPLAPLVGNESLTWSKAVALGMSLGIKKDKMLMSFPLYGYEWQVKNRNLRAETVGDGVITSFAPIATGVVPSIQFNIQDRVKQYGASHDPLSGSSHYQFRGPKGQFFQGWFEDWWTLERKSDFLVKEELGGIAFFILGYDGGYLVDYFLRRRGMRNPFESIQ